VKGHSKTASPHTIHALAFRQAERVGQKLLAVN